VDLATRLLTTPRDLGMRTNLAAHHVKVLTDAGLVVRGRSEGDRRRTYLPLRP
jgi:DNA-binding MarR family transcriptional regulator